MKLKINNAENYSGKRIIITGGAGFVGSNMADTLLEAGAEVTIIDNLSSGLIENISNKPMKFLNGDIRNSDLMDDIIKESDYVFHLAEYIPETKKFGAGHVIKYSVENPLLDFDVSCIGSLTVLEKCRKYDKPIVFTSSAAVYGEHTKTFLNEDSLTVPSSPYGASKLCAEVYMALYARLYKLPVTVVRFCNVYGPRQRKYLMFDTLLKLKNNPKTLEILGTGLEERDFIFVDDAINAVLLAANASKKAENVIFNIGTGISTSIKTVVEAILSIKKIHPQVVFTQASWTGDIRKLGANVDKIKSTGFIPEVDLESGLRKTIEWFNLNA